MWGLFHKAWNKDPRLKQPGFNFERYPAVFVFFNWLLWAVSDHLPFNATKTSLSHWQTGGLAPRAVPSAFSNGASAYRSEPASIWGTWLVGPPNIHISGRKLMKIENGNIHENSWKPGWYIYIYDPERMVFFLQNLWGEVVWRCYDFIKYTMPTQEGRIK